MSLKYAICGFLTYGPLSGYDLNRIFNKSASYFWPATQSQIYRTLEELSQEGWAKAEVIKQESRPDRKLYHLTEQGKEQLKKWVKTFHPMRGERMPLIVQFFFSGLCPNQEIISMLEKWSAQHRARLADYRGETRDFLERAIAQTGKTREGVFWSLSLSWGVVLEKAWIEWIDDAIEELRRLSVKEAQTEKEPPRRSTGKRKKS